MFFTFSTRKIYTKLKQIFIEALILNCYDLECHLRIEIDASSNIIDKIVN